MSLEQWLAEAGRVAGDAGEVCSDFSVIFLKETWQLQQRMGDALVSWLEEARHSARAAANRDHHDDADDDDGIFVGPVFSTTAVAPLPRRGRPNQLWQEMVAERAAHLQPVAEPVLQEHDPPAPCEVSPVQATNGFLLPCKVMACECCQACVE